MSSFFPAVSVCVNLLNSFSAVAVTLRPVARCLWAEVGDVAGGENLISALNTFICRGEGWKGGWGDRGERAMGGRKSEKEKSKDMNQSSTVPTHYPSQA